MSLRLPRILLAALLLASAAAAPAAAMSLWERLFGSDEAAKVTPGKGFAAFDAESARIEDSFYCESVVERGATEFDDRRRHCMIGEHRTARVTIYEPVGFEGLVKRVKFTWLDNERRNARGDDAPAHADREAARQAVRRLGEIYVPGHVEQLMELFTAARPGLVSEGEFIAILAVLPRGGFRQQVIDLRDANFQRLSGAEAERARPGYEKCIFILNNMPPLKGQSFEGDPIPERNDLYVTYFINSARGERFLCELHNAGYYRIRVSQQQGQPFRTMAHGNLGRVD